jgi:hypothetical protein
MQESATFEYIARPNQSRFLSGKHVCYNEYSMQSDRLQSSDNLRILGFGDSVLNGGTDIDHDSLATGIIKRVLNSQYPERNIRCLNISCTDWEPDNCFAYIEEYDDFDAGLIFLVVSSHDAYDNMDFRKIVGVHLNEQGHRILAYITKRNK